MSLPTPILTYSLSDATVKGLLPNGYTPLTYLESTGTLWINTGITFNAGSDGFEVECLSTDLSQNGMVLASASGGYVWLYDYSATNKLNLYILSSNGQENLGGPLKDLCKHLCLYKNKKYYVDGVLYGTMVGNNSAGTVLKIGDLGGSYHYKGKIYYVKLWTSNALSSDLRPARRDSDGVLGMYDLVSKTFKTNSGTGTFIAGPELAVGKGGGMSLPEEYLLVEYLESTGTQRINTGLIVNSDNGNSYDFESIFTPTVFPSSTYSAIAGVDSNTQVAYTGSGYPSIGNANGNTVMFYTYSRAKVLVTFATSVQTYYVNGSSTGLSRAMNATDLILLFCASSNYHAIGRMEYAKFGSAAFFIPCYRKSDMKPGMYDVIRDTFYTNAGTGEFILGPTVTNVYTWEPNAGLYGGENLLVGKLNARGKAYNEETKVAPGTSSYASAVEYENLVEVYRGDTFTVSFDAKADIDMTGICYLYNNISGCVQCASSKNHTDNISGSGNSDGATNFNVTTSYKRYTISWTMNPSGELCIKHLIVGRVMGNSTTNGKYIYIKNVKFQRGISTSSTLDSYQGLYTNVSGVYDSSKGWVASGNSSIHTFIEFPKEIMNPLMTAKTFTIAFWFRVHNNSRHILFGSSLSYPLNIEYYPGSTGKMRYYFSGSPDSAGTINITPNTWYHSVLSVTPTGFIAYVNGSVDQTYTSAPLFNQFSGNCRIGSDGRIKGTSEPIYMDSDITNFQIFNTALTEAQVKELYGQ